MTKRLRFLVAVCGMFWAASADARQSQENTGPPQSSQQGPDINGPIQRPKEESAILPSAAQHEQSAAPTVQQNGRDVQPMNCDISKNEAGERRAPPSCK
jgi:hypothetical protein